MSNEKKETAVEWLFNQMIHSDSKHWIDFYNEAKEMEIAGKESSYTEGYSEGYKRALELIQWMIKTEIKRTNDN
jgi:hypothetical protein